MAKSHVKSLMLGEHILPHSHIAGVRAIPAAGRSARRAGQRALSPMNNIIQIDTSLIMFALAWHKCGKREFYLLSILAGISGRLIKFTGGGFTD